MAILLLLLLAAPKSAERMLLGDSPFFRHEGMERAVRAEDWALLEKAAESVHWDARLFAAEGLGGKTPLALLEDPVAVVREAAVRALDVAAPEPVLVELLEDDDDAVRAAAAWALRAKRTKGEVRALLRDPSPAVRFAALAATGNFSRLRRYAVRDNLAHGVAALAWLGRAGGPSDAAFLLPRFRRAVDAAAKLKTPLYLRAEPGPDVALARAVGDLARRGVTAGGRPLDRHLRKMIEKSELEGSSGILLAEAVAGARDAEAARRILDRQLRIRKESTLPMAYLDPGVRGVLHAFSREPWPELDPLLLPFLARKDPFERIAVARALSPRAARVALRDAHPGVRAAACARVEDPDPLVARLRDDDPGVVSAAARALAHLGKGGDALAKLLHHADASVRLVAVGALLRIDVDERADRLYRAAIQDRSERVRGAAAAVIGFLDEDDHVLPKAIADLGHESGRVRTRAIALVRALTAARFTYDPKEPDRGRRLWEDWWRRRSERRRPPDAFRYHVEDLRRKGIDLVLVVDATGSMSPVIQAVKRRIQGVVSGLRRIVPDLRARVVFYRDKGDVFLTIGSPLTHEPRVLEDFVACVPASGGGDAPEGVLAGVRTAIERTRWREGTHRIVVVFGDAPPHEDDVVLLKTIVSEFDGTVHAVDAGGYGRKGEAALMPAFVRLAQWGRGTAVRLKDERDLLRSLLVLTLGARYRTAVETLFGL